MAGNKSVDSGGDSEWAKLCRVSGVFAETEQVYIGKVMFNGAWKLVLVCVCVFLSSGYGGGNC
jgi:hypothetical protein